MRFALFLVLSACAGVATIGDPPAVPHVDDVVAPDPFVAVPWRRPLAPADQADTAPDAPAADTSPPESTDTASDPPDVTDTASSFPDDLDVDRDGDGFCGPVAACPAPWTPGDCDDADASVNPGADDVVGDQVDNDCDGVGGTDTGA